MNKLLYSVLTAAVAFGSVLSCEKEVPFDNQEEVVPGNEAENASTWSFTANMENPQTKMTVSGDGDLSFGWENGDGIKILWDGGNTTAEASVSAGVATFSPAGLPAAGTDVWVVYPSGMTASLEAGSLKIGLPAVQKGAFSGYFVAKAKVGDASIAFKHPVCYYKFVVGGDGADVTRLELVSAAGNNLTAASMTLEFDGSGVPSVASLSGAASEIDVDFSGAGTYYVPVVPGVSFDAADLKFQYKRTENAAYVNAGAYKHSVALDNNRAEIVNWADMPSKATNRYVSTSASGSANGASAGAPWDIAQFKAFMEDASGRTAAGTISLFDGINIHFAAGTYTPASKIAPNINIRTNLIGEDKNTTKFDGNSALIFDIWKQSGETVTFKDFTFQNATNSSDGGVVRIGNSDRVFNIAFENCIFSNNTASGKSGGVFCITGANAELSVKDCAFNGNVGGSCGGVLHATSSAVVTFDNCTFTGNSAVAGGVLDIQGTTGVTCNDCTFTTNSATKYGGSGTHKDVGAGAIILRTSGDAITLYNCTFAGNTVTGFGGVIASCNKNTIIAATDCMFSGNNAGSGWGSAIHLSNYAGQRIYLNRCVFKSNTTTSRGVIGISNSTSLLYMNSVTFKDNTNSNNNAWGVAVQASGSVCCMNNVTTTGNHSTNASPGNTTVFNADSGWLITNSSIIDQPATALVRDNGTVKTTVCNSILINTTTPNNVFVIGKGESYFDDCGHNVLSCDGTYNNAAPVASDKLSVTALSSGTYSEVWNSTTKYGVYTWANDLSSFTAATQGEVEAAIKGYDVDFSTNIAGVTHVGNDFWAWLTGIGATGKDGRGEDRVGKDWPGSYQQN
ncbi:MAG: hypothetical protein K6E61_02730 [Bacteroidales bacterium]|nr:hypothetical protein [Bacteroidales bacterium]